MSKKTKAAKQTKSTKPAAEQQTATTETVQQPKAARQPRIKVYSLTGTIPAVDSTKSKQLKIVLAALPFVIDADSPVRADVLASMIAARIAATPTIEYKVRDGNVEGSIGFHLHQLSRNGVLKATSMVETENGLVEAPVEGDVQ